MSAPPDDLSPRAAEIAAAARVVLEARGYEGLSMRRVAASLGRGAPSLYEHLPDKRAIENALIAIGLREQGDVMLAALDRDPPDPLWAITCAFRDHARAHPHLYRLIYRRDLDREAPGVAAAEWYAGEAIRAVVHGERETAVVLWAFAHGMVILELNERFPPGFDLDALWRHGLGALRTLVREAQ